MKQFIGYLILAAVFVGIYLAFALSSNFRKATIAFGSAIAIAVVIVFAIWLIIN